MRTILLRSSAAALTALLAVSGHGLAEQQADTDDPLAEANADLATPTSAEDIAKGSAEEDWLINAIVSAEGDGEVLGAVVSVLYDADDHLEALVIEATDGNAYDLPAETVTLDAASGMVTTTAALTELAEHQGPIEPMGEAAETLELDDAGELETDSPE